MYLFPVILQRERQDLQTKNLNDFLKLLWADYTKNPERGLTPDQVYDMVETIGGKDIREKFIEMTSTTKEIDLETLCVDAGLKFEWETSTTPWLGIDPDFNGDRVGIKVVTLDGPAYKAGLNAGDEIIAINGMRILKDRFNEYQKFLHINKSYTFTVARLNMLHEIDVTVEVVPAKLKAITIVDKEKLKVTFNP